MPFCASSWQKKYPFNPCKSACKVIALAETGEQKRANKMKFIADFHIHSHFSIATSKQLIPEYLDYWAKLKGITVIGTGDFTHPGWIKELKEKLEPAEPGLFKLKKEYLLNLPNFKNLASFKNKQTRFLLTSEISSIYKKNGKVRKVHNVIFSPDFETVEKIQQSLIKIGGNITSDGRPILGLDSKNLLEIALNASENIFFVPAHIWTPWFSVLGDKSGFDTIEGCFEDLTKYIFAVETGLSSNPPMNWICSFLDKFTLISNSDAHSPEKLGRNANRFDTELSYNAITNALKTGNPKEFLGTIDLFPQEGKYHYDGHRKCNICWDPVQTLKNERICPVCGKKVTVGVMNRVVQLSDRDEYRKNINPFQSIIPLKEIISEIEGVGPNSKKVDKIYFSLLQKLGSELDILLDIPIEKIKDYDQIYAEAIRRMRNNEIYIKEGFDGEFGIIKVFHDDDIKALKSQDSLFGNFYELKTPPKRKLINFDLEEFHKLKEKQEKDITEPQKNQKDMKFEGSNLLENLNPEQKKAVEHFEGSALIIAGPGTGKTRVIAVRIAHLIKKKKIKPENILAITFTNKASEEMKNRVQNLLDEKNAEQVTISTFHAFGYNFLKQNIHKTGRKENFSIIDEDDKKRMISQNFQIEKKKIGEISNQITKSKQDLKETKDISDKDFREIFSNYETILKEQNLFDLDDLIYQTVRIFKKNSEILSRTQKEFQWILIDEFQDINFAQYKMIRFLAPNKNSNICVIGDPNQAIYGFRRSDVKFIEKIIKDFPKTKIYKLQRSYRCSENILSASHKIISDKIAEKSFLQGIQSDVKIKIAENRTDKSEAEFVARTIEQMMGGLGFFSMDSQVTEGQENEEISSLSDFAVLCRIKAQMKFLEKAFIDHKIPYQKIGTESLFSNDPVKTIIEILKFIQNPEQTFLRDKLSNNLKIKELDYFREISNKPVSEIVHKIIERYFSEHKEKEEIQKLINFASNYNNLQNLLKNISLGTEIDTFQPELEKVTLMTLHAAKGLEFQCVFIVGCEDGLLPYSLFESQKSDLEEERRLLYVGMTRAKKFLYLTNAKKRFLMGKEYRQTRSPFLDRIEKEMIEFSRSEYKRKEKKDDLQMKLFG